VLSSGCVIMLIRALHGGGAQADALALAQGLAAQGWPMVIATLHAEGPLRARLGDLPLLDLGRGRKRRMATALPDVRRMMLGHGPAAVIASEASANCLLVAAAQTLPAHRRPAIILREVAAPVVARHHDPYRQNRIGYALAPWLYPRADRVVALTEGARRDLVTQFGVPASRAVNLGTNAVLTQSRLRELATDLPRRPDRVVAVGRLSPEKQFDRLITAFAAVPGELLILGEGPERPHLEALIDRLGLVGRVSLPGQSADPLAEVRRAALFVSASRYEGFGNAIVEALACGTTVVATDVPHGPAAILAGGRYGTLVPADDPAALGEAIRRALHAPADHATLRARAADFTTERAATRFGAILAGLGLAPAQRVFA
jgi:glycosyltransferase involved in cell wall biosynthesis